MFDNYVPAPVDTSRVVLSDEMTRLIDRLAFNYHETLVKEHRDAGWKFGDRRDYVKRTHPGMIPYDDLTDDMKRKNVRLAEEMVKAILVMGYDITPVKEQADHCSDSDNE